MSKNKRVTFKSTAIFIRDTYNFSSYKILMPSKDKIGEIEVRKVEVKAEELVKIPAYAVDKDSDVLKNILLVQKRLQQVIYYK